MVVGKETFHGLKIGPDCYFDMLFNIAKTAGNIQVTVEKAE